MIYEASITVKVSNQKNATVLAIAILHRHEFALALETASDWASSALQYGLKLHTL